MAQPTVTPQNATTDKPDNKPAAKFRWVINREERLRVLVLRATAGKGAQSAVLSPGPRIDLLPGANVVDAALWRRWKEENADRTVDGEEMTGQATLLLRQPLPDAGHRHRNPEAMGLPRLKEGPAVRDRAAPLADLADADALEFVAELRDETQVRRLLVLERRSTVAEALRAMAEKFTRAAQQPV